MDRENPLLAVVCIDNPHDSFCFTGVKLHIFFYTKTRNRFLSVFSNKSYTMRKLKKRHYLLLIVLLLIGYVAHIFTSTGYFRTIENTFEGKILKKINLVGAEDIIVSRTDSFAIVSSTDRFASLDEAQKTGALYFINLRTGDFTAQKLTKDFNQPFAPHGISMFQTDSIYTIAAISHTTEGEFIEFFELIGDDFKHTKTVQNDMIFSPNDLVLLDENRFYVTNDHKYKKGLGRLAEDYLGLAISNVIYADGENYTEVADGIAYANGINFDVERNLLFVASPRGFLMKVFEPNEDGSLNFVEDIDCGTGVDNIEFDSDGNIWIGCHPNLLEFASYAKGKKEKSPSEIIKIDYRGKGDYQIEQIYMEDGSEMSASTVAATFGNLILVGNVMDQHFLILEQSSN
jgi:arylesterase/paraoxonase